MRNSFVTGLVLLFSVVSPTASQATQYEFEVIIKFFQETDEQPVVNWGHESLAQLAPGAVQRDYKDLPVERQSPNGDLPALETVQAVSDGMRTFLGVHTPTVYFGVTDQHSNSCTGSITGSQYCPAERSIYITSNDVERAYERYGGSAGLAYIVAHEFAHAIQHALNTSKAVSKLELQADCLAGFFLHAAPNLTLQAYHVENVRAAAWLSGDYYFHHRQHHGTPLERLSSVQAGLLGDLTVCFSEKYQ